MIDAEAEGTNLSPRWLNRQAFTSVKMRTSIEFAYARYQNSLLLLTSVEEMNGGMR